MQSLASDSSAPVASLGEVRKEYGGRPVVDGVTLAVMPGQTTMLVGPNGCGKTTSMEILVGLRRPTAGRVEVLGEPVRPDGPHRLHTGVQLQQSGLPSRLRVNEALQATASLYRHPEDIRGLADALGLANHWKAPVDKLSGGLRRRLDIATACVGSPRFLLLDEPTSGIDPEGRADLWEFLRLRARAGTGILASTHDLEEAEAFADRLYVMSSGQIALEGTPAHVIGNAGGDWRLRMNDATPPMIDLIERSGAVHGTVGITTLVVGPMADLEELRTRLQTVEPGVEVRSGRTRLEDVFAVTMWKAQR